MFTSTCPTCDTPLNGALHGSEVHFCPACGECLQPTKDFSTEALFAEAIKIDVAARAGFLDQKCGANLPLRRRLEELLQASDTTDGLIDVVSESQFQVPLGQNATGETIDHFKLLQKIGEGGFGVVYMAEQVSPVKRKVALKVIKPGMDSKSVVARFEAERQALALMDHSHIARVYDGGTTPEGRPYFVMELVKGVPITTYCDDNKLSIEDRLRLFVDVCEAVHHAHQKGIIHRDIKPSNVMVTLHDGKPIVKVIDFGVAKAMHSELTEKTLFTAYGQMIGTPQYMSPEQAEMSGLDVDTRSDIFSLGILLYELLTGTTPLEVEELRSAGLAGIQRLIRDKEPSRPSLRLSSAGEKLTHLANQRSVPPGSLPKQVRGELDWIVLKSLAKERDRRYDSAAAFADDLTRFLGGDTVAANPPSMAYRWRKIASRHKLEFGAALGVFSALVVGLVVASWQWHRANIEKERAENERRRQEIAKKEVDALLANQVNLKNKAKGSTYEYGINAAFEAYNRGNRNRFVDVMSRLDTDEMKQFRGFEWNVIYPTYRELLEAKQQALTTSATVSSIAYHPNGELLAIACDDGDVSFVHPQSRSPKSTPLTLHGKHIAFSSKGKYLVATDGKNWSLDEDSEDYGIQVWRCDGWAQLEWPRAELARESVSIALSPDESIIAILIKGSNKVQIRNIEDGSLINEVKYAYHTANGFSPKRMFFRKDGILVLAGVESGKLAVERRNPDGSLINLAGSDRQYEGFTRATMSSDGRYLMTGEFEYGTHLWGLEATRIVYNGKVDVGSTYFLNSKQEFFCVGGSDQTVRLWDAARNREAARILQESLVTSVATSPDGTEMAIGTRARCVEFWNATELGRKNKTSAARTSFPPLELTSNGAIANAVNAEGRSETLTLWNPEEGQPIDLWTAPKPIGAIAISPNNQIIASMSDDGVLRFRHLNSDRKPQELPKHSTYHSPLVFSPNGKYLVAVANRMAEQLWFWDLTVKRVAMEIPATRTTLSLAFHPNGHYLAVGSGDGPARDGELVIWDIRGERATRVFSESYQETVRALSYSPDGNLLAFTSRFSAGEVSVVDGKSFKTAFPPINAHSNKVTALAFSPDGNRLITGGDDGFVRFWELDNGRRVGSLFLGGRIRKVKIFSDGHALVAYDENGSVRYWPASTQSRNLESD